MSSGDSPTNPDLHHLTRDRTVDLTTSYLGLTLKHPFTPGASPMSASLDTVRRLEDAGASAIVLHSLFEEQLEAEQVGVHRAMDTPKEMFAEALSFMVEPSAFRLGPDEYLEQLRLIKASVDVPVIASLNGTTPRGWLRYAKLIEEAGADALELNTYDVTFSADQSTADVEQRIIELVGELKKQTSLAVTVKIIPAFAGLPAFAKRLTAAGADGLVLFNRSYDPVIDVEELEVTTAYPLSTPGQLPSRLRALAMVSPQTDMSLACSGGVHDAAGAVRALMCGATTVQMVSALLRHGPELLAIVIREVEEWIVEHEYESLDQLRGSMNLARTATPQAYTRSGYILTLQGWAGSEEYRPVGA